MITKIVGYFLLGFCFIAFFLAMFGVTHIVTGSSYYTYLGTVSRRFESWRIVIPNIPKVPSLNVGSASQDSANNILQVLKNILNFFKLFVNVYITFLNALISVINLLILVFNYIIAILQFICTYLFSIKDLIDSLNSPENKVPYEPFDTDNLPVFPWVHH